MSTIAASEGLWRNGRAFRSTTNIKTLDLISEGPIEGLVYTYLDFANKGTKGTVGYNAEPDRKNFPPNTNTGALRSVFWNEVPVLNNEGQLNFQNAVLRQTYGLPSATERPDLSSELTIVRPIQERFRKDTSPKIYRIYNRECRAIYLNLRIISLAFISAGQKDTHYYGYTVNYEVFYRPFFSDGRETFFNDRPISESLQGYVAKGYLRQKRINFNHASKYSADPKMIGWEIKINRTTGDELYREDGSLQTTILIDSIQEIYLDKFSYPNSAIIVSTFNSEYFAQVPQRAFDCWLKKVKIPSNYSPNRKYYDESTPWDGTFLSGLYWTDNPAWIYYDLITNKNYGLGNYLSADQIDKWTLYDIAKYCDTLVDDGYGGLEPRFTCNLYLQTREDAYKVLNDLASVFNAITYYGAGLIYAVQDSSKDPIITFTNANVEDGNFNYSNSSKKFRHTVAMVRWNDPANFYRPVIEFVEDLDNVRKFGIKQVDLTAFACSSRGQAIRLARYIILSENLETETINFITGLEAAYLRPGDIFKVFDRHKKAARFGGRTSQISDTVGGQSIYLDDNITALIEASINYKLSLLTPSSNFNPEQHSSVMTQSDVASIRKSFLQSATFDSTDVSTSGSVTKIDFAADTFDTTNYSLDAPCIWTIELVDNPDNYTEFSKFIDTNYDLFRVIKVDEKENNKYEVFGLQYRDDKFAQIEDGLTFSRPSNVFQAVPADPVDTVVVDQSSGSSGTSGSSGSGGG